MNGIAVLVQGLGLFLAVVALGRAAEVNPKEAKAVAEIGKFGGRFEVDKNSPDKSVVVVNLRKSTVTDAGLGHLKGLTRLQSLDLYGTKITDVGLDSLKGLTNLQSLDLSNTKVTDAGLEHLKGFTKLHTLYLMLATEVTDEAMKNLRQALPTCEIWGKGMKQSAP